MGKLLAGRPVEVTQMFMVAVALLQHMVDAVIDEGFYHPAPALPPRLDPSSCGEPFTDHPLILLSLGGFRPDYLNRGLTPALDALGRLGVRAPYMKPSYPTLTFPNHYSIVTGLYPAYHGIVANEFYDPVLKMEFKPGTKESNDRRFWLKEPIWKTVSKMKGKKSATLGWPGSETSGHNADYKKTSPESEVLLNIPYWVGKWLDLPTKKRPSFIAAYYPEPDKSGHDFGPYSIETANYILQVDRSIYLMIIQINERNLLHCVNIMIVSDHGMAEAGEAKAIHLDEFIPNLKNRTRFWEGAFARMEPNNGSMETKLEMMEALSCKIPQMRVYEKSTLPIRLHMGNTRRVEDIILDVDPGHSVGADANFRANAGERGYDNIYPTMNGLFVAYGPEFRSNVEVEAFQNIELYNLMCHLVGVEPKPNNGTWGALHHMLANPPYVPLHTGPETPPTLAGLPMERDINDALGDGDCEGDKKEGAEWISHLRLSEHSTLQIVSDHLPWGVPRIGAVKDSPLLMVQPNSITGYSTLLKMPLWSSFTLSGSQSGTKPVSWRSDIRLTPSKRIPCANGAHLKDHNVTRLPLFSPEFNNNEDFAQLPYLMSNAVYASSLAHMHWKEMIKMVKEWTKWSEHLNVIVGPVFDYDSDTMVDNFKILKNHEGIKVPSHLFMVLTRCLVKVDRIRECPQTHLDALAFVFPQFLAVSNCLSAKRYAQEFIAKVQDVEKITGFEFFPDMVTSNRVRLAIRIHSNIWGEESWGNRLQTGF